MAETWHERRVDKVLEDAVCWMTAHADVPATNFDGEYDFLRRELLRQFEAHWAHAQREQADEVAKLRARVAELEAAMRSVEEIVGPRRDAAEVEGGWIFDISEIARGALGRPGT